MPIVSSDGIKRTNLLLNNENYFQAYLAISSKRSKSAQKCAKLSKDIDFLKDQINQLFGIHNRAMEYDHRREVEFKSNFDSARDMLWDFNSDIKEEDLEMYKLINNVLGIYYDNLTKNREKFEYHYINFVNPFIELYLNRFEGEVRLREIINKFKVLQALYAYRMKK